MKKIFLTLLFLIAVISGIFSVPVISYAQSAIPPQSAAFGKLDNSGTPITTPTKPTSTSDEDVCSLWDGSISGCLLQSFNAILQQIGNLVLAIAGLMVGLAGMFLDDVISQLVIGMSGVVSSMTGLFIVWRTLRDFANMFFIFILLYIAIQTMLDKIDYKKWLIKVITVALLINFSFFFTSVAIDASNVVAVLFYNGFATTSCVQSKPGDIPDATSLFKPSDDSGGCFTYNILQKLKLGSVYGGKDASAAANLAGLMASGNKFLVVTIGGAILELVLAFVFLASGILLLYRFVTLIVLLMLSPLAFIAYALPGQEKNYNKWLDALSKQLIFAPVYFMFLWIVMSLIMSGMLQGSLATPGATFQEALANGGSDEINLIINYVIVVFLLGYSLTLASILGAKGADKVQKWGKSVSGSVRGFVGRNTLGFAANKIANSDDMKRFAINNPTLGRMALSPLNKVSGAAFGGKKGGYDKAQKDAVKREEDFAKSLGPKQSVINDVDAQLDRAKEAQKNARISAATLFKPQEDQNNTSIKDLQTKIDSDNENLKRIETKMASLDTNSDEHRIESEKKAQLEKQKAEAESNLKKVKESQQKIHSEKLAAIDAAHKATDGAVKNAQAQVDKVKGVDEKEAKKRAATAGFTKEAGKTQVEIDAEVDRIQKENKGIAKDRKEKFAKALERLAFTSKETRAKMVDAVRKQYKGKQGTDKAFEDLKNALKEEGKNEGGGEEKEEKKEEAPKPAKKEGGE